MKTKYDEVYRLVMKHRLEKEPDIDYLFYDFEIAEKTKYRFLSLGYKLKAFYPTIIFKESPFYE